MLASAVFPRFESYQRTGDPRPEEARAFLSARRLEGRLQAKSCPLPSFETVTRSKLRATSSG
jgi:hypothetical protein